MHTITQQYNNRAKKKLSGSQVEILLGLKSFSRERAIKAFEALTDITLSDADYDLLLLVKSIYDDLNKGVPRDLIPWIAKDVTGVRTF